MKTIRKLLLGSAIACALGALPTIASALPNGFIKSTVWQGLNLPTAVKFAANGNVFVAEKNGIVKMYDSVNDTTATVAANLTAKTYTNTDHGLLGLAVHPNFPATPYIYVLYSYLADPSHANWPQLGANGGRLSRLTITNGVMTAETPLITGWCEQSTSHAIGDINFGPDGMLYVSSGDGASPGFADYGQGDNSKGQYSCGDPIDEGGSMRSQDLLPGFNSDPVDFNGTLLRLDPLSGTAATGNPLLGGDTKDDRIVAYGLRNPFRFTIHPTSNEIYIGDVGWDTWEEIDRIQNPLGAVKNFGWPCYEGNHRNTLMDQNNKPICENALYTAQAGLHSAPFWEYPHNGSPNGTQAAITAVAFYNGNNYPAQYKGALFFGDYTDGWTKVAFPDANGVPIMGTAIAFDNTPQTVQLVSGANGDIFYVEHNGGKIYRYSTATQTACPIATLTTDKTGGAPGVTVNFDGSTSSDPGGAAISFDWDLNGDGAFGDSTISKPVFSYANPGTYIVSLKVASPTCTTIANQVITVSNQYPLATISSPTPSVLWKTGDLINFAGNAVIPSSGEAIPANQLDWRISVYHCALLDANVCHTHTVGTFIGTNGSFEAPDHEYPSRIDLQLTATGPQTAVSWWNNAWTKRRWLFFNNYGNNQALTNFPVLVQLDATRIDYAAAGTNGASLRFIAADGATQLPYEIETWNPAGTSYVWVKIPSIAANMSNNFAWMYYGNAAAASAQNAAGVWNNGYVGVWHMNSNSLDSSPAANNGANNGATDTPGKIGIARIFNGTTSYISVADSASLDFTGSYTLEAWVKVTDPNANRFDRIISKKGGFNDATGYSLEYNPLTNQVTGLAGGPDFYRAEPVDLDTAWHYVVATVNGATGTLYVDGVNRTSDDITIATVTNNLGLNIGRDAAAADYFNGSIDEIRVSNVTRSAAWVAAQNRSMNNKLINFSAEESPAALKGSSTITIQPQTSSVTVNSSPQGLNVGLNGEAGPAPITHQVIVNATTNIIASTPQNKNGSQWSFLSWNDSNTQPSRVFAASAASTDYTASFSSTCASAFPTMNVRGSNNLFVPIAMTFNATTCQWELASITFGNTATERFKFDVSNDWVTNFGDNAPANGIADQTGEDIAITQGAGDYKITFNDVTLAYSVQKIAATKPIANAGADKTITKGGNVTFSSAGSSDPNGTIVNYSWTSPGMPTLTGASPTQTFATPGTYTYTLTVTDNDNETATDQVVINVNDWAKVYPQMYVRGTHTSPIFVATTKMALVANNTWQMDATFGSTTTERFKFDVNGDWVTNFGDIAPANGVADAGGADIKITQGAGTYRITFNDNTKTYTVVKQANTNPIANAGPDQTVLKGTLVTFNGAGSSDPNGSIVQWVWTAPGMPTLNGFNPTLNFGTPGSYTYTLTVTDNDGLTATDQVVIKVNDTKPVANAGPDQTVTKGANVTFNGAGSSDPNGPIAQAQFVWTATGMPTLNGMNPTQVFATAGTYTYTLTVTDIEGQTATDQVVIKVNDTAFTKVYPQVYVRGTHTSPIFVATTKMALIANNTWQMDATFGSTTTERFKFDVNGDWVTNFGDNAPTNGIGDAGGADIKITQGAGTYRITFKDNTKAYTVVKL